MKRKQKCSAAKRPIRADKFQKCCSRLYIRRIGTNGHLTPVGARRELISGLVASPQTMDSTDRAHQQAQEEFRAELLHWVPNVSRFARMLTRNADDADDLTQETILRACANWATFRAGTDCRRWLFAICRNLFLRDQQRSTRVVTLDDPETDVSRVAELYWDAVGRGIEGFFDRLDLAPALERSLRTLPQDDPMHQTSAEVGDLARPRGVARGN